MTLALFLPKQLCKQKNQPEVNSHILKNFYLESNNLCRTCIFVWACAVTVFLIDSIEYSLFRMLVGYLCSLSSVDPLKALPVSTADTCEFVSRANNSTRQRPDLSGANSPVQHPLEYWVRHQTAVTVTDSLSKHTNRTSWNYYERKNFFLKYRKQTHTNISCCCKSITSCKVLLFPCQLPLCCSGSSLLPIHWQNVMFIFYCVK